MNRLVTSDSTLPAPPKGRSTGTIVDATTVPESGTPGSLAREYPKLLTAAFVASAKAPAVTVLSLLAILVTCGATLAVGLPQMTVDGHDVFGFLDGGWRVLQGQVPHVDFYSAMGPLYYLVWAAGLKFAHYRVEGIVYVTALLGVVLGLWSFAVVRNRLGALCATVCTVLLVCLWLAPFAIGDPSYLTTYAMQYNRLGYVLFLLIFIELLGAPDPNGHAQGEWGGCSSGLALGLLLFLKANFFMVALVPLACVYVFRIKNKRHGLFLVCGFLAALLPMSWYLHWHLGSMVTDLRIAAGARVTQGALGRALVRIPLRNFTTIAALVGLALLAQALPGEEKRKAFSILNRNWLWIFLVLACDFAVAASNYQRSVLPLSLIAMLLLVDQLIRSRTPERREMQRGLAMCLFVVVVATALPPATDLVSAWESETLVRMGRAPSGSHIDASQMAALGFKDYSDAIWWGAEWHNGHLMTGRVNDGIALLRQHTTAAERIVCLCFANPFSYALLRQPPRGGSPFLDDGSSVSETSAPSAERLIGDADLVIYPKADPNPPTVATLLRICEPILSKNYRNLAESEQWVLLQRQR